ncbi:transcription initiation factor TFIID subunit 7, partial [Bonamia ostreae]
MAEQQIILRLPENLAKNAQKEFAKTENPINKKETEKPFILKSEGNKNRIFRVKLWGKFYPAVLYDLPCHIDSQKRGKGDVFYKSGDISQILKVYPSDWDGKDLESVDNRLQNNDFGKNGGKKRISFKLADGISPPTQSIRHSYNFPKVCNCDIPIKHSAETAPALCSDCGVFYVFMLFFAV